MRLSFILGSLTGFILVFVIMAILFWVIRKTTGSNSSFRGCKYDERQMLARGVAFKYAFFTLVFSILAVSLLPFPVLHCTAGMWICICLSIMVLAIICIEKDAYISLSENIKGVTILFLIIAIANLLPSIELFTKHTFIEKGELNISVMNFTNAILFFILTLYLLIHSYIASKQEDEEDDI